MKEKKIMDLLDTTLDNFEEIKDDVNLTIQKRELIKLSYESVLAEKQKEFKAAKETLQEDEIFLKYLKELYVTDFSSTRVLEEKLKFLKKVTFLKDL